MDHYRDAGGPSGSIAATCSGGGGVSGGVSYSQAMRSQTSPGVDRRRSIPGCASATEPPAVAGVHEQWR